MFFAEMKERALSIHHLLVKHKKGVGIMMTGGGFIFWCVEMEYQRKLEAIEKKKHAEYMITNMKALESYMRTKEMQGVIDNDLAKQRMKNAEMVRKKTANTVEEISKLLGLPYVHAKEEEKPAPLHIPTATPAFPRYPTILRCSPSPTATYFAFLQLLGSPEALYPIVAGGFVSAILCRRRVTRLASFLFGSGVGIGSAYSKAAYMLHNNMCYWQLEDEEEEGEGVGDGDGDGKSKQIRSEKRSRKAMLKIGKPMPRVSRTTIKKSENLGKPVIDDYDYDDDDEEKEEDEGVGDGSGKSKQIRCEKKSLKAMLKLGMKPMPGVSHVAIRKSKNILLVISRPDVYKNPMSEKYVVISEENIDGLSSQLQSQAAEQFRAPDLSDMASKPETSTVAPDDKDVDMDETGVEAKDIDLVMTLAGVPRSKAVKALKSAIGGEKKIGKAMLTLGMKPMPGVSRVTINKGKKILVVISEPDIYKSPNSETYVVIGDTKIDLSSQLQTRAAEEIRAPNLSGVASKPQDSSVAHDDGDVNESSFEAKDIELVMTRAEVPRSKAVKALQFADGDVVSAIMDLTN